MDMEEFLPKMRDEIKAANENAIIDYICDNMIRINEECDRVKYDDSNKCMYVIRKADQQSYKAACNFLIVPYSMVQYIKVNASVHSIKDIALKFGMDTEVVESFVKENTTFTL